MTIGDRIKAAREKAQMTQSELGNRIGVSGVAIMRYEKNQRQPRLEQLQRIADALGIQPWELSEDVHDITEIATALAEYKGILKAILETGYLPPQLNEHISKYVSESAEITLFNIGQRLLTAKESSQTSLSDITAELLELFEQLNTDGQQKAVERVEELTEIPRYRAETPISEPAAAADNPSSES